MTRFSSLRARLVGTVFLAIAPAWAIMYYTSLPWAGFGVGLLALFAAWLGGEAFVLRQIRLLIKATDRLVSGDYASRTGLAGEQGELGDLARKFDHLAEKLECRVKEREEVEKALLNRSLQQTVVSALGQFALVSMDYPALLNQVIMLVSQTLEIEYCSIMQLEADRKTLRMQAGLGWKDGIVGSLVLPVNPATEVGAALTTGEPSLTKPFASKGCFRPSQYLAEHRVLSGITVAISGHGGTFGTLGAYTGRERQFTGDEINFLLAIGTLLAMAAGRAQSEAQLQKLASFAQLNPRPALELAESGALTFFNEAAQALAGSVGEESPSALLPIEIQNIIHECLTDRGSLVKLETVFKGRTLSWSFHPVLPSLVVHAYVEDITERLNLQAQLFQSQKMESVGRLAAGVAHDFNNMLTVIQGHSGMLLTRNALPANARDSLQAISFAAERATNLTRQLLMFSRRSVMLPKPVDLREVVAQMSKMLTRLLGEDVNLVVERPAQLPLVYADAGMLEQVLMNLAVNARDAMPKGGALTITTHETELNGESSAQVTGARSGKFVCLQVSDTGCGMDAETRARAFEPFFTTKEVGKGTGLGLATVYGIVKQHEGWIELESELARGTTFRVFLPALAQDAVAPQAPVSGPAQPTRGHETILAVEDERVLRDLARAILEDCGYRVLEASSGPDALRVWDLNKESIDLLLTDMVMPEGMSGFELAQRLRADRPNLRVVFATGYSVEETNPELLSNSHSMFIQKPYTHISLAGTVRECLDK